jgi:hypothetical protein
MQRKEKLAAAVSAAVSAYLQEEQEAYALMQQQWAAPAQAQEPRPEPFRATSPWSLSGRQAIMERRFQWQFRLC